MRRNQVVREREGLSETEKLQCDEMEERLFLIYKKLACEEEKNTYQYLPILN